MKAGDIMVSVQWGGGYHYFVCNAQNLPEAVDKARVILQANLNSRWRKSNKGAKPAVHVWEKKATFTKEQL